MFVDDIVLVNQIREEKSSKLERWRETLESKGLELAEQ